MDLFKKCLRLSMLMGIQSSPEKRFQTPTFDHSRVFFSEPSWRRPWQDASGGCRLGHENTAGGWWLVVTICDPNHSPRFKRGILEIDMLRQQSNRGTYPQHKTMGISEYGCLPPTLGSYIGRLDKSWGSLWLYRSRGSRELLGLRRFLLLGEFMRKLGQRGWTRDSKMSGELRALNMFCFLGGCIYNWYLGGMGALHIRKW